MAAAEEQGNSHAHGEMQNLLLTLE
jgi:hypothetical protein